MARFVRDPGCPSVPEFVHGELQVTLNVEHVPADTSHHLDVGMLDVVFRNAEVSFVPDPDASRSPDHRTLIERVIRNLLRSQLQPVNSPVHLPDNILDPHLQTLPNAHDDAQPAVALQADLADVPSHGTHGRILETFLERDAFAVAIAREYLLQKMRGMLPGPSEPYFEYRYVPSGFLSLFMRATTVSFFGSSRESVGNWLG